jgi:hypothetical protein
VGGAHDAPCAAVFEVTSWSRAAAGFLVGKLAGRVGEGLTFMPHGPPLSFPMASAGCSKK